MVLRRWKIAALSAVLTAVSMAGSVVLAFTVIGWIAEGNVMSGLSLGVGIPLGILLLSSPFLLGGGVWAAGQARLVGAPMWPAARTGALSIAGMIAVLEFPVHMSQALPVPDWMPFGFHGTFTLVFSIEVALVAGVATARLSRRLGFEDEARATGKIVGLAAAGGFFVGSMVALAVGFETGTRPPENMVWALHLANVFSGLSAGWALGWLLGALRDPESQDRRATAVVAS